VRIQGQCCDKKRSSLNFFIEENITAQKHLRTKFTIDLVKTNKELEDYAQIVSA
jgi:hypothetical protein